MNTTYVVCLQVLIVVLIFIFLAVMFSSRCMAHHAECPRQPGASQAYADPDRTILDMLLAGSACTDFSSYGSCQQQCGPTMKYLLLLIRLVLEYQPDIFLHENVTQFPLKLLQECLHGLYSLEEYICSPETSGSGFPIARVRKYIICRKESTVRFLCSSSVLLTVCT